jgi:small subunit ribosomal protein S20
VIIDQYRNVPRLAVPRIKSAKKRMRQTKVRTAANKARRSTLRTAIKKARTEATPETLKAAEAALDKAGRKNLVHRNTAARLKSRIAKAAARKA